MSLKAFHVGFIVVAIGLAAWTGVWAWGQHSHGGGAGDLAFALAALAATVGLIVYLVRFVKKMKDVSYL